MRTILIVDDEAVIAHMIGIIIRRAHPLATIIHVSHGDNAWQIINDPKKKPDIVISDINMNGMSGIQLAAKIQEGHPDIHVILMSGYEEPEGIGGRPFLKKPFDAAKILKFVNQAYGATKPK